MTENRAERTVFPMEQIDVRHEGGHAVLALPSRRGAWRVNAVGAAIAEAVQRPVLVSAVEDALCAAFDVGRAECAATLDTFLSNLERTGVVEILGGAQERVRRRYLDLLKRALVNLIYPEHELRIEDLEARGRGADPLAHERRLRDIRYTDAAGFASLVAHKRDGFNWQRRPARFSHTMIGLRRLDNLDACAARVFADGIPGDFLEAGVLQGGASIFLRALQVAYEEPQRRMWLADSFAGLPAAAHEHDREFGDFFTEPRQPWLAWPAAAVRDNFRTYDLLSDEVRFIEGWFAETLPGAPVGPLAILRVDADLYASTRDVLVPLYDRVSPGGFVIIDDYHVFEPCRRAVDEFRASRGDQSPLRRIDWTAVYWRKPPVG
jgi:O-methyltransferase